MATPIPSVLFAFGLGPMEMMIVGVIAVLLFGKRLPEVARSLGKGVTEFKKGVSGIEDEINLSGRPQPKSRVAYDDYDDRDEATAPKFEPPAGEPTAESKPAADESVEA